jgi:cysteine desulfurase
VLLAIGISAEVAQTAVRFSFSHDTSVEELSAAVSALVESVKVFI